MKGIIPRAMEQVGHYKSRLEEQGWCYGFEVCHMCCMFIQLLTLQGQLISLDTFLSPCLRLSDDYYQFGTDEQLSC